MSDIAACGQEGGRSDIWGSGDMSQGDFTWGISQSFKSPKPGPQEPQLFRRQPLYLLSMVSSLWPSCEGKAHLRASVSRQALNVRSGPPSGLLRLEELVRGFLISKETLSVRMLDDSQDPTPLLKEIRDDKVSTIIIDANASISHLVLRKVGPLSSPQNWGTDTAPLPVVGCGFHRVC